MAHDGMAMLRARLVDEYGAETTDRLLAADGLIVELVRACALMTDHIASPTGRRVGPVSMVDVMARFGIRDIALIRAVYDAVIVGRNDRG